MEHSAQFNEVLALGRRLTEELGMEDSTDTLGRWMAHHLADLMKRAEGASKHDNSAAHHECFDAILAVWKHRSELPMGKRPFEELEPVIRAVESLDPENSGPRYHRNVRYPDSEKAETSEQEDWLALVEGLDYSAKVLIGFCLAEASALALDKSKDWVKQAAAVGEDGGVPEIVIRFISKAADEKQLDPNAPLRTLLEERLKRLTGFIDVAESIAETLATRLSALPSMPTQDLGEEEIILTAKTPIPSPVSSRRET